MRWRSCHSAAIFPPKSLLQTSASDQTCFLFLPFFFLLLSLLFLHLNISISLVTDSSYGNLDFWISSRPPKAGSSAPGETLNTLPSCLPLSLLSAHKDCLCLPLVSLLISISLPGETLPLVMTHVHILWASFSCYIFMWIEVKEQIGGMQWQPCWLQFWEEVNESAWPQ